MRAGISAAIVAASLLSCNAAWSACPPGQARTAQPRGVQSHAGQPHDCLDLNLVPQVTQQLSAVDLLATPPKPTPAATTPPAYAGPTVGVSRTVRQAPMVGYRWSID